MSATPLAEALLRGVAANPAAPSEVLLRLLAPAGRPAWPVLCGQRALPPDVVEAVLAHPESAVRRAFARSRCAAPEQRGRLADDPEAFVRISLASGPRPRLGPPEPLPDAVLAALLTARDGDHPGEQRFTAGEIAEELEFSGQIPQAFRRALLTHPHPALRAKATGLWLWLAPEQRAALLADPDEAVAAAARRRDRELDPAAMEADLPDRDGHTRNMLLVNYAVSHTVAERCLAERRNLWSLAANPHTPAAAVARLARDPDPKVRERVAARADLDPPLLAELAEDPDEAVRLRALVQPLPRTWPQRSAIDRVRGCGTACGARSTAECVGPVPEMVREPETAWYAACADSPHPLLRRVAATCRLLPEEVVHRLAADPEPDVRHLLALNHPLAPPAAVLDAFLALPRRRPYLLTLPRLPRTGLAHLLGHQDAEVRALAAGDPALPAPPTALLTDPDGPVRRAAAANPLLAPAVLDALLDGPDPDAAEGAAANPGLPAARLHALLDRCG
ncbi:hypothetical protein [Streptomyces rubellomurinus]|uniref:Leucine rich repeat variant n=1 Tax=Streptomyces rubellomurinus (strain ATCC 31215) TaxID=359131 RepID=A0A0F2TFB2_STRR3|nr:hypothetical protein [Streptomyces rubellomurinus]KJS61844.1 hypothetical protein VM95_12690 [Streptomyces rubellomurinus]